MQNNGLYGCYYGFRAIILHTFGAQVFLVGQISGGANQRVAKHWRNVSKGFCQSLSCQDPKRFRV